jgi:hypothetical protein
MSESPYRIRYRPIIAQVLSETQGQSLRKQRAALRAAFPNPPHKHHPYMMWLAEARDQLLLTCLPPGFPKTELLSATGRAVCADWWLERDDAARAAFLIKEHRRQSDKWFSAAQRRRIDELYGEAMAKKSADVARVQ